MPARGQWSNMSLQPWSRLLLSRLGVLLQQRTVIHVHAVGGVALRADLRLLGLVDVLCFTAKAAKIAAEQAQWSAEALRRAEDRLVAKMAARNKKLGLAKKKQRDKV